MATKVETTCARVSALNVTFYFFFTNLQNKLIKKIKTAVIIIR